MKFQIRDEKGQIFNTVEEPAAVFDKESGTLHKIGDRENILSHFEVMTQAYRVHGFHDIADDITFMELPKNQEVIDKVFQNTGYIKRLYDKSYVSKA